MGGVRIFIAVQMMNGHVEIMKISSVKVSCHQEKKMDKRTQNKVIRGAQKWVCVNWFFFFLILTATAKPS